METPEVDVRFECTSTCFVRIGSHEVVVEALPNGKTDVMVDGEVRGQVSWDG